ncbi:nucleoside phosphorylase [Pedobacter flavus]|uniref:Uridine phosphorylase n=1 Tax=Pedobacter flavus TaxID=3113906 RepID=A0ABU7H2P9_9SPHI|nr:nucleoside phosphorylase [Pedobacter sp. VNH31]MEE1885613.1 nucleoside phosphorylase [Pedobacter sp. VNH31]
MKELSSSDLVINPDGSIYHLNIRPEDLAHTIITVGDPDRVAVVSKYFDLIELKKGKREFKTHTGYIGNKRISVISTGIGTDNIDIVMNELDALVNINFNTRTIKPNPISLDIIRIGTSGAIQPDVEMGTILASTHGIGLDALMHYYTLNLNNEEQLIHDDLQTYFSDLNGINPYISKASEDLLASIGKNMAQGITVTAPGFYAPQGRLVRAENVHKNWIEKLNSFRSNDLRITNLEMETAGIYALAKVLGHKALSVNAILASRVKLEFSKQPDVIVEKAIKQVLERLS